MPPTPHPKPLILIPWYGPWPDYLPLFLDGCRRNPDFEVCLFGVDPPPGDLPPSVRFVPMPLAEFGRRFSVATGLAVNLQNAYKLCDFKPVLGEAMQDYLEGREFWGFGDLDLTWGNLNLFAPRRVLERVDIFCVRKEWVSGSFTLIRNQPLLNSLYRRSPDWQRVLTSPEHFCFDECSFQWYALATGVRYNELNTSVCSFSEVVFTAVERGEIRGYFESIALEWLTTRVAVTERGVFASNINYALLHFVIMKQSMGIMYPHWSKVPARYFVTRRGVFYEQGATLPTRLRALPWKKIVRALPRSVFWRVGRAVARLFGRN